MMVRDVILVVSVVCSCLVIPAGGFSTGLFDLFPPVCKDLTPKHTVPAQPTLPPYGIRLDQTTYRRGEKIQGKTNRSFTARFWTIHTSE